MTGGDAEELAPEWLAAVEHVKRLEIAAAESREDEAWSSMLHARDRWQAACVDVAAVRRKWGPT